MRFARYSSAFLKKIEKDYNFDYFYSLIKLLIKKGFKSKAYKIVHNFSSITRVYFLLLYRKELKKSKGGSNLLKLNKSARFLIEAPYINMNILSDKLNFNFFEMFRYLIDKYAPFISFVKRKVAAKVYELPYGISFWRSRMLLLRWFVKNALLRKEKKVSVKLFREFLDLYYGVGKTVKKLQEYYEYARMNYPFIKYMKKRKKFSKLIFKKYHLRIR